jgi:predicted 3-demethylubiquinone-9 3-methyltransferase (glyoxalase superfamily)
VTPARNTICHRDAEGAANFYAKTFPDTKVQWVHKAPGDFPFGKNEDVLPSSSPRAGRAGNR